MSEHLRKFEHAVMIAVTMMMALVVVLSVLELGWVIVVDVVSPPVVFLELDELLEIFGAFFVVLIGIELLETLKALSEGGVVRVEFVVLVALMALSRKVIISSPDTSGTKLFGLAAVIIALAATYYFLRRSRSR